MHPLDKAEKIIRGIWPKKGVWIYESPDNGLTVFRRLGTHKPKQLYYENDALVADIETLDEEYAKLLERGNDD